MPYGITDTSEFERLITLPPSRVRARQEKKYHLFRDLMLELRLGDSQNSTNLLDSRFSAHPDIDAGYYDAKRNNQIFVYEEDTDNLIPKEETFITVDGKFIRKIRLLRTENSNVKRRLIKFYMDPQATLTSVGLHPDSMFIVNNLAVRVDRKFFVPCVYQDWVCEILTSRSSEHHLSYRDPCTEAEIEQTRFVNLLQSVNRTITSVWEDTLSNPASFRNYSILTSPNPQQDSRVKIVSENSSFMPKFGIRSLGDRSPMPSEGAIGINNGQSGFIPNVQQIDVDPDSELEHVNYSIDNFPYGFYRAIRLNEIGEPSIHTESNINAAPTNLYVSTSTAVGEYVKTQNNVGRILNYTFDVCSAKKAFLMTEKEEHVYKAALVRSRKRCESYRRMYDKYSRILNNELTNRGTSNLTRKLNNILNQLSLKLEGLLPEEQPIYLGLELEVLPKPELRNTRNLKEIIASIANSAFGNHCVMKSDTSIGDYGFEIVTIPATLEYHKEALEKNFFGPPNSFHKKLMVTNRCGIHVHISKKVFTKLTLGKFIAFFNSPINRSFIDSMANRPENSYCSRLSLVGKKKSKYVKDANAVGVDVSAKIGSSINLTESNGHLPRGALNFGKPKTVEVRIFKATSNKNNLFRKLEFCEAVVKFVRCHSMQEMTSYHFVEWFTKNKDVQKSYPYLRRWLASKNYIEHTTRKIKGKNKLVHLYGKNNIEPPKNMYSNKKL